MYLFLITEGSVDLTLIRISLIHSMVTQDTHTDADLIEDFTKKNEEVRN